jgi:hypothetical protein
MPCPRLLLENTLYQGHWAFSNKLIYRRDSVPTTDVQRDQVKLSHTQVSTNSIFSSVQFNSILFLSTYPIQKDLERAIRENKLYNKGARYRQKEKVKQQDTYNRLAANN